MENVAVFARLRIRDGLGNDFIEQVDPAFAAVAEEPGTLIYALHQSEADPDTVWFYELYADAEAFELHGARVQSALGGLLQEYLAERPEIIVTKPVRAKGIILD